MDENQEAQVEAEGFFEELGHANEIVERPDNGKSHISVQTLETPDEGQSQPEEVPQGQPQPNLNHLINDDGSIKLEATDEEMKQLGVDNPKSYRTFQSQFHKERAQRERERQELLGEIEKMKTQSPPKQEEVFAPPEKPQSDDPIEKMEYLAKMVEYQNKVIEGVSKNFQAEQQRRQQIEQEAQQKAYITGQLVNAGATPEEAGEIINGLAQLQSDPNAYAKFIVGSWRGNKQPSMQNQQKVNAVNQRVAQQGQAPPLGVVPSQTETPKRKDDFWGDMTQWTNKNY